MLNLNIAFDAPPRNADMTEGCVLQTVVSTMHALAPVFIKAANSFKMVTFDLAKFRLQSTRPYSHVSRSSKESSVFQYHADLCSFQ